MLESNAYQGVRALDKLREVLDARAVIASKYRQLLSDTPGITFQRVPQGTGASHYQLSVTVDAENSDSTRRAYARHSERRICFAALKECHALAACLNLLETAIRMEGSLSAGV